MPNENFQRLKFWFSGYLIYYDKYRYYHLHIQKKKNQNNDDNTKHFKLQMINKLF